MVISDQNGNIFAVSESGELLHNRHLNGDPTQRLIYRGTGRRIPAQLTDFRHWIAWPAPSPSNAPADSAHFAFFRSDGTMYYNRIDGLGSAAPRLALPTSLGSPATGGVGSARRVFCDKGGTVYWLSAGALIEGSTTIVGTQATLAPRASIPVGFGMSVLHLFSAGPGRFFSVDLAGALRYHEKTWLGQLTSLDVSQCWDNAAAVLAAGDGGIYSITTEGDLRYTRATIADGGVSLDYPGYGQRVSCAVNGQLPDLPPLLEGYCWPLSVAPGETVAFKVSLTKTAAAQHAAVPYQVRYVRLRIVITPQPGAPGGYVESFEPEEMLVVQGAQSATLQSHAGAQWRDGCGWSTSFQLQIPVDQQWPSGLYAAECCPVGADPTSNAWYVVFILRPAARNRGVELAVLSNTNTWNAYNGWGGKSKYHCYDCGPLPQQLSFERPNPGTCPSEVQTRDVPPIRGMTACGARAELWVLTWLEDNGYPVHLYSDYDLDRGIDGISQGVPYKALILNTHPEYWSEQMYNNLEAYLANGGNLVYLGGNAIYEQVGFAPDGKVMNVLQQADPADVANCDCNARDRCLWRNLGRPETAILGVGFRQENWHTPKTPYEVKNSQHPFLQRVVGQQIGTHGFHGPASQWEIDVCDPNPAANITLLARGTNDPADPYGADMVCRQLTSNFVFSVGSLGFGSSLVVDGNLQQILQNVLTAAGIAPLAGAPVPQGPSPANRFTPARASAT